MAAIKKQEDLLRRQTLQSTFTHPLFLLNNLCLPCASLFFLSVLYEGCKKICSPCRDTCPVCREGKRLPSLLNSWQDLQFLSHKPCMIYPKIIFKGLFLIWTLTELSRKHKTLHPAKIILTKQVSSSHCLRENNKIHIREAGKWLDRRSSSQGLTVKSLTELHPFKFNGFSELGRS